MTYREHTEAMLQLVAKKRCVDAAEIAGRSRVTHIVAARHQWIISVYNHVKSLSETARLVGRDHTTVMAVLRAHGMTGPLGVRPKRLSKAGAR